MTKHDSGLENHECPAYPGDIIGYTESGPSVQYHFQGLTKREEFAKAAMQGMLSNPEFRFQTEHLGVIAVRKADALLKALEANDG